MSCDVGKATEGLENELWRRWSEGKVEEWAVLIVIVIAELILQPFHHFTYVTTHSPTLLSLYLRYSSFYNPSIASPTSQFILQPFFRFSYVTRSSLNSHGEPPILRCMIFIKSVKCSWSQTCRKIIWWVTENHCWLKLETKHWKEIFLSLESILPIFFHIFYNCNIFTIKDAKDRSKTLCFWKV